jgi:hypothetical protein
LGFVSERRILCARPVRRLLILTSCLPGESARQGKDRGIDVLRPFGIFVM